MTMSGQIPPPVRVCDALAYALAGVPVFPCRGDKSPMTPHGHKDASADPAQVFAWWGKLSPDALGLPTGPASGLWALDVDAPKPGREANGRETLAALESRHGPLPATVEQRTGGGGRQMFFAWPQDGPPVKNSASRIGPGLDVRGQGGYVIVPPSLHQSGGHYAWAPGRALGETTLALAPDWLLAMVRGDEKTPPTAPPSSTPADEGATPYGQKALAEELALLASAMEGERNESLNRAAFRLGQLVAGGQLERPGVEAGLFGLAVNRGLPEREARATIASGLEAGQREPRGPNSIQLRGVDQAGIGPKHDDEWEPSLRPWPKLSPTALHGLAGDFVRLACRDSEADPAAVLVTFLVRFGAEVGPGPHALVGDAKHPPRIFAVVVGASSKARKGTSGQPVQRVFTFGLSLYVPAHNSPGPLSTGEGLVYKVRDPVEGWQIVDKKTGQGQMIVVDPGEDNKRLFVLDEELAAALQCTKREGNTLSTVLRTLWDSGNVEPLTKTSKAKTTGAHIGLVTHITAPELARLLDETQALNGFANRFLWVCARRQKVVPLPTPMPEAEVLAIQGRLLKALDTAHDLGHLDFDPEARALWLATYPELSQDHPGLAGTVINRGEAQVLRLALVYALLDSASQIQAAHLQAALALWSYCRASALYVFGRVEADPIARRVLSALEAGPLSGTDLYRILGNHASKARLESALSELLASGRVTEDREATKGRSRRVFRLCEKSEVSEASPPLGQADQLSSLSSLNSPMNCANEELWQGPAEMVL